MTIADKIQQAKKAVEKPVAPIAYGEIMTLVCAVLMVVAFFLPWMGYNAIPAEEIAERSWISGWIGLNYEDPVSYLQSTYPEGAPGRYVPGTMVLSIVPFVLAISAGAFALGGFARPAYRRINTTWVFLFGVFILIAYHLRSLAVAANLEAMVPELRIGYWLSLVAALGFIFQRNVPRPRYEELAERHAIGNTWRRFFFSSNIIAFIALATLFMVIIDQSFGLAVYEYTVDPATLSDRPLEELDETELAEILYSSLGNRIKVVLRDSLSVVPATEFTTRPLREVLAGRQYPPELADLTVSDISNEQARDIIALNVDTGQMLDLVLNTVVQPRVQRSWRLFESILQRDAIESTVAQDFPEGDLQFRAWVSWDFITSSVSSNATTAGLRTALLGSLWIIAITLIVALPIGVAAAIYLEEYATDTWLNRIIELNIRNLAGVPSIIYGLLGLAVFARALEYLTSGRVFGITDSNGRTVLSAALTLALLILPVIIISAQEAVRAVPRAIREGSFGVGATKWQTVRRQVLPAATPGIMTGLILAMSRAVGETAPLIVVGASTFIGIDPNGPFSKFTVVPIQIYQWTSRPELEFKSAAGGAIIVLLGLLLILNATAIIIRQRFSGRN